MAATTTPTGSAVSGLRPAFVDVLRDGSLGKDIQEIQEYRWQRRIVVSGALDRLRGVRDEIASVSSSAADLVN